MTVPAELALILDAFDRNARVNRAVLAAFDMDVLNYSDGVGGFNIGQHLADIVEFRRGWLSKVSPKNMERLDDPTDGAAPTWLRAKSIQELQAAFDAGDAAMRNAVVAAVQEGRSFEGYYQSHPAALIQHCIVHDAHHRGQIMALLRQSGRPAEAREALEEATWPIWRE